jgi:hypothetical protein
MIVHLALRELRDDRDLFFLVPVPQPLEGLPTTPFGRRIRKEPMLHLPAVAKIGSLYVPSFSFPSPHKPNTIPLARKGWAPSGHRNGLWRKKGKKGRKKKRRTLFFIIYNI